MKPIPPPPVKLPKALPPPPVKLPPPPVKLAPYVPPVNHHVRRVTLNLIRHAHVCPAPLRAVLDRLADVYNWDVTKLSSVENEIVYGHVDDRLAEAAKAEFAADVESIVDHRHCDAVCQLCGHRHIRFEFLLQNSEKGPLGQGLGRGRDVWTGSTCIEEYGLNVQGAASAEDALRRLRAAIAKAKEKVTREEWQAAHPNHAADINAINVAATTMWGPAVRRRLPEYRMWALLPSSFAREAKRAFQWTRAIVKFYDQKKFLTDTRTSQLYAPNGLLAQIETHRAQWDAALQAATPPAAFRRHWMAFKAKHAAIMTPHEVTVVETLIRYANNPAALWERDKMVIAAIEARANPTPAVETQPQTYNNTDLPF